MAFSLPNLSLSDVRLNPASTYPLTSRWSLGIDDRKIEQYAVVQVQPAYPLAAQRYRIEGTVTVEVLVKDEAVVKANFLRGHTVFKAASIEAAKQWRFKCPEKDELTGTIDFTFKLDR